MILRPDESGGAGNKNNKKDSGDSFHGGNLEMSKNAIKLMILA